MSKEEANVREATEGCLDFWCKNEKASKGAVCVHDACSVLSLFGALPESTKGSDFKFKLENAVSHRIFSVTILPVGEENAAAVRVSIGTAIQGWLVLLQYRNIWTCISAAFSSNTHDPILPEHFDAVNKLTWDGYCRANETCDDERMAQVFHRSCRLTFASESMGVVVVDQPAFLKKVARRYEDEAMHQPYAELKHHPKLGSNNTLQSIEFATNDLCMVTLKVGHPPCLWTDLLTCCNLGKDQDQVGWWIVHKSSCHEPFPLTDDMKALLE